MSMALKDNLRRIRKERGLSQQQLADAIGARQNTIAAIEIGKTKRTRYLVPLARVLECSVDDLDPDVQFRHMGEAVVPSAVPALTADNKSMLPVYAGTEVEDGVNLKLQPIEWIARPTPLASVKDAYALMMAGESMQPQYWPGDLLLVHPHLPPTAGAAFAFYGADEIIKIRHLIKITPIDWRVRQWNPPDGEKQESNLSRRQWPNCHRIIGVYSRR